MLRLRRGAAVPHRQQAAAAHEQLRELPAPELELRCTQAELLQRALELVEMAQARRQRGAREVVRRADHAPTSCGLGVARMARRLITSR
jgi:hypothetical protein